VARLLVLVQGLALLVLARLAVTPATLNAQASGVEMLHRFAIGTTPQSPVGVTAVPEGGALVVNGATSSAPSMITRVLPDGTVRVLHTLPFTGSSGTNLVPAPLVRGGDGGYYGATTASSLISNHGSIVRVDVDGRFTTVYTFQGGADGTAPSALFPGLAGTVYGFTRFAPSFNALSLVFVIGSDGTVTPNVAAMSARPVSMAADGAVYGLSVRNGCGAVRRLRSDRAPRRVGCGGAGSRTAGVRVELSRRLHRRPPSDEWWRRRPGGSRRELERGRVRPVVHRARNGQGDADNAQAVLDVDGRSPLP
jgi:hypothetical protein